MKLTIYGEPVAQGRARATATGGYVRMYDPKKSSDYKQYLKLAAANEMKSDIMTGAIELTATFYRPIPKSFSKKKAELAEQGILRPITKPDTDNYTKALKDALKGVVWRDDNQVTDEYCKKRYSARPRVEVEIREA